MIFPVVTEADRQLPFYLLGVGCYHLQEHVLRPNGYPSFQWIQCYRGKGELILGDKSYLIDSNQGIFLYPSVPHEYYALEDPWEVDWITFGGSQLEQILQHLGFYECGIFRINQGEHLLAKIRQILNTALSGSILKSLECSSLIYELLIDVYKNTSQRSEDSMEGQHLKLQPVITYIEENYHKSLTLQEMADTIRVSPQHLCYLFKTILKIRPFEYLNHLRITQSKELLINRRELQIKEISALTGFDNVNYFCYLFKKLEGVSPGDFRSLHG